MTLFAEESPLEWERRRMVPPQRCVLRHLVDRWANEQPGKIFARFPDCSSWTYRELRENVLKTAKSLQVLGVQQGDLVLSWLPNGADALRIWFGLNYLGAVYVPINIAYKGRLLEHVIENSQARLIIVHADLVERLNAIDLGVLEEALIIGGRAAPIKGLAVHSEKPVSTSGLQPLKRDILPWDTQAIMYTSGTTGPSKGVMSSYFHLYTHSVTGLPFLDQDDTYMVNLPLFHLGGTMAVYSMLTRGGTIAIVSAFNTDTFWPAIKQTGTTAVFLVGVMAGFLAKARSHPDERNHSLRKAIMVPATEESEAFSVRFGCDIYTLYNMTETSVPLLAGPRPHPPGTCGRPRPGVEIRIVDENDCEVPVGEIGELVVRTDAPWAMNHGYFRNEAATAEAWRNGWFHTGDAMRCDPDGNYFFVDRIKDAIRRRGENISSYEIEIEVCAFPAVREAAAIAVPSDIAEDEVLIAVSLVGDETTFDPAELIEFLRARVAHFMIPRYVRVLPELPRTPTERVMKYVLRAQGITPETWDREKAGIRISREKIGEK